MALQCLDTQIVSVEQKWQKNVGVLEGRSQLLTLNNTSVPKIYVFFYLRG